MVCLVLMVEKIQKFDYFHNLLKPKKKHLNLSINLIINAKLTRILFTTEIIAQMFDAVKRFNKNLVKKFDTNKYVGYDEKNNWGGACV